MLPGGQSVEEAGWFGFGTACQSAVAASTGRRIGHWNACKRRTVYSIRGDARNAAIPWTRVDVGLSAPLALEGPHGQDRHTAGGAGAAAAASRKIVVWGARSSSAGASTV